jgi:hypothetical protein
MEFSKYYINIKDNHSKYYKITLEPGRSTFCGEYGRIGEKPRGVTDYPIYKLDSLMQTKLKKGYIEVPEQLITNYNLLRHMDLEIVNLIVQNTISAIGYNRVIDQMLEYMMTLASDFAANAKPDGEKRQMDQYNLLDNVSEEMKKIQNNS